MSGASIVSVVLLVTVSFLWTASAAAADGPHLRREQRLAASEQPPLSRTALVETHSGHSLLQVSAAPDESALVRPSAGKGADKIDFALFVKNFYGDDLKDATFQIDVVMSLEWMDTRVVDLVPADLDSVTVASDVAAKNIWMPEIVVTNRDIDKYEIISSSVTMSRSGKVVKVERCHVKICEKFALIDYPFDTESLRVVVASSKYMLDDLVLVPSARANSSGVDCPFGGYVVAGWSTSAFEETDGELVKSRGMLDIRAVRNLEKYRQDHLVPTSIVLAISCAVFYFPMVGPFVTPRLALSILALLTFTNLMVKSGNALPGPAPYNWNDLLNQQVQGIMFLVIVVNIFSEICWHTLGVEWLAKRINHEAKVFIPLFSLFDCFFVMLVGYYELLSLRTATIAIQSLSCIIVAFYFVWVAVMLYAEKRVRGRSGDKGPQRTLSARMMPSEILAHASAPTPR